MSAKLERAHLMIEIAVAKGAPEQTKRLDCWFNPTTLAVSRSANWNTDKCVNTAVPTPTYLGGESEVITLNLLLHAEDQLTGADVQANINDLLALVEPLAEQKRPPTVTLVWGKFVSCLTVAKTVDVTVELFAIDGTPLRALVNLTLRQYQAEAGQAPSKWTNPTTRATHARRAHHVRHGETVHLIAHRHLRDPARWRAVAEFNELDDPLRVRAGDVLVIPTEDA